jgi:cAMP phosphodiesterase
MQVLQGFTGNDALKKVKIIITHIKPEKNVATTIQKELMQNNMHLQFQLAQQAKPIYL